MKRWASIFFLCLLLIQAAGCYIYFVSRLVTIRKEMREQLKYLPEEKLTRFQFTPEEFRKVRVEDHEIKVAGKMFDIARITEQGRLIVVFALHDEAEDNLFSFLGEMVSRSANDKKPVPVQIEQLLTLSFLPTSFRMLHQGCLEINHTTPYRKADYETFVRLESPPPRG